MLYFIMIYVKGGKMQLRYYRSYIKDNYRYICIYKKIWKCNMFVDYYDFIQVLE